MTTAAADWSASSVLDMTVVAGQSKANCRMTSGRVEVCNSAYRSTGWLGVAGISISGSDITQGYVKLNDTYFNTSKYNTPAWRALVTCQKVGHTLGLDHQDENFSNANLGTCMDYTNDSSTNQHSNAHDYDQLVAIYTHTDSSITIKAGTGTSAAGPANGQAGEHWGAAVRADVHGRPSLFVKNKNGVTDFTWVYWAD